MGHVTCYTGLLEYHHEDLYFFGTRTYEFCRTKIFQNKTYLRKHYLSNNSCKKPCETEEEKNQKEPEIKYRCPGHAGCTFFGPLRLILIHMYKHPEANVKFRLKKSKLLPVKCEECSFHYTTRSSLSKAGFKWI